MPPALETLPQSLRTPVAAWWNEHGLAGPLADTLTAHPELVAPLVRAVACSQYLSTVIGRYPSMLGELADAGLLSAGAPAEPLPQLLTNEATAKLSAADCMTALRRARHRELLRIAWQDLTGGADAVATLRDLSALADALVSVALDWAERQLTEKHGSPIDANGRPATPVVLAMGKLGGGELNFSSDIDLIFLFTGRGETSGPRIISNEQYFRQLAQRVINLLSQPTADGFAYRVDVRLRPFGDSGPLAVSLAALEDYLVTHGRDWERYAYVKARAINRWDGREAFVEQTLRPFVYRRYLDYGVFASLRSMKAMIEAEGRRREYAGNLKLGPGGIREIEFVVQSLQLIRGGDVAELRQHRLLPALAALGRLELLPINVVDELREAYLHLRQLENRLQAMNDEQVHDLPDDAQAQARLALAMGEPGWTALLQTLDRHRLRVAKHFKAVVFGDSRDAADAEEQLGLIAAAEQGQEALADYLRTVGLPEPAAAAERLQSLRAGQLYQQMDEPGRQRLDALLPRLISAIALDPGAAGALDSVLRVVQAIGRRSAYFALLSENPDALARLVRVCAISPFLVQQLAEHPLLLDELLDPRVFLAPPELEELAEELAVRLDGVAGDDDERQLLILANFQRAAIFRIAISDLNGVLPVMQVSDRLTELAELVLGKALQLSWDEVVARHGLPGCEDAGVRRPVGFAIVAYGKLGGLELGYGSDLDLVFVHDSTDAGAHTDGESPLDNSVFFARLVRRLIHKLTVTTTSGRLYEIDTRLRPSGQSGLMVTSLKSFERYQREDAWTWEHQALLRSRSVAGSPAVREQFEVLRRRVLADFVRHERLRDDVVQMRARMRAELGAGTDELFDLKQDRGGITDIEFLVQYLVLKHASGNAPLTEFPDNIRQLDALVHANLLEASAAERLADSYRDYRGRLHRLSLTGETGLVPMADVADQSAGVITIWQQFLG